MQKSPSSRKIRVLWVVPSFIIRVTFQKKVAKLNCEPICEDIWSLPGFHHRRACSSESQKPALLCCVTSKISSSFFARNVETFTSTQSLSCFSSRWEEKDTAGDSWPFDWNLKHRPRCLSTNHVVLRKNHVLLHLSQEGAIYNLTLCRGVESPLFSLTTAQSLDSVWSNL